MHFEVSSINIQLWALYVIGTIHGVSRYAIAYLSNYIVTRKMNNATIIDTIGINPSKKCLQCDICLTWIKTSGKLFCSHECACEYVLIQYKSLNALKESREKEEYIYKFIKKIGF